MSNNSYLELLKKIKNEFNLSFNDSKKIEKLNQLLFDKKATYQEANELAVEVGKILKNVFGENITENILADGVLTEEIANILIRPNMMRNYDIVSTYSTDVQQLLNRQSDIGLKAMKPSVNKDRINGIVKKISEKEFNDTKWLLGEPIINFTQSVVDDTIRHNTELQYKSGLKPKIKRKEFGKCCDWCRQVVGEYEYPDVPDNVYKRHRYCRCTVEYLPGNGKTQDVWSKKWKNIGKSDKIKERIRENKKIDYKPLNDGVIEKYQSKSNEIYANLSKREREALSEYTQGGYLDINADLGSGIESYYTKSLNSSIDKFTVDSNIITYRGTNEKYYKGYRVGDVFEGKVFYSTSVNQNWAKAFADDITQYSDDGSKGVLLEIKIPKGSKALYIGENTDYDDNEYELLLSNKAKYKIEKIENGKMILEMIL